MENQSSSHREQITITPNSDFSPSMRNQNSDREEQYKVTFSWKTGMEAKGMKASETPKYHSESFSSVIYKNWDRILSKSNDVKIFLNPSFLVLYISCMRIT